VIINVPVGLFYAGQGISFRDADPRAMGITVLARR